MLALFDGVLESLSFKFKRHGKSLSFIRSVDGSFSLFSVLLKTFIRILGTIQVRYFHLKHSCMQIAHIPAKPTLQYAIKYVKPGMISAL